MTQQNVKDLSNSELIVYKKELSDEFEATKSKIDRLCEELAKIEKEYNLYVKKCGAYPVYK